MTNPVGYEGEPLVLLDGRTVRIKYGMRSLMRLEDDFGGIAAVQNAVSQDMTGKAFGPAVRMMAAGLLHEHDGKGAPLTPDTLADLLDPLQFQDNFQAVARALAAAFPRPAAAPEAAPDAAATGDSRGPSGTTSPPSSSDGPTPSSG